MQFIRLQRPEHQQVNPLTSQTVFLLDSTPGIDYPLEKLQEQKIGTGFFFNGTAPASVLGTPKKLWRSIHKFIHVQPVVRGEVPVGLMESDLSAVRQLCAEPPDASIRPLKMPATTR